MFRHGSFSHDMVERLSFTRDLKAICGAVHLNYFITDPSLVLNRFIIIDMLKITYVHLTKLHKKQSS